FVFPAQVARLLPKTPGRRCAGLRRGKGKYETKLKVLKKLRTARRELEIGTRLERPGWLFKSGNLRSGLFPFCFQSFRSIELRCLVLHECLHHSPPICRLAGPSRAMG